MNPPTSEQREWAREGLSYTILCYEEWTRDGGLDYTPMLNLLEYIRSSREEASLSVWKSLMHLSIASASHVSHQYRLRDGAPAIHVTQYEHAFKFWDAAGSGRWCDFDEAIQLYQVKLVGLKLRIDQFDKEPLL